MAAPVPTSLTARLRAGETLSFQLTLANYSAAAGYSVTWYFRALEGSFDFTSSASGSDHLVNVPFAETATWLPGSYRGVAMVSDGTTKTQVWAGPLVILPNLAAEQGGYDTRSQARRTLDNINAVLEKRASATILDSTIEGTSLRRIPVEQLLALKAHYDAIVAQEENAEAVALGLPTRKNVFARFTTPR